MAAPCIFASYDELNADYGSREKKASVEIF